MVDASRFPGWVSCMVEVVGVVVRVVVEGDDDDGGGVGGFIGG